MSVLGYGKPDIYYQGSYTHNPVKYTSIAPIIDLLGGFLIEMQSSDFMVGKPNLFKAKLFKFCSSLDSKYNILSSFWLLDFLFGSSVYTMNHGPFLPPYFPSFSIL